MGIDFNERVLVANHTTYFIGRIVICLGILGISIGVITHFTDDFLIVPSGWVAFGIPTIVIGVIMVRSALRKN